VFLIPSALAVGRSGPAGTGTTAEQLDIICHDFDFGTVLAFLFPAVLAEFAVNAYLFAFNQVLVQRFPLPAPENYVEKVCFVNPLIAGFPPAVNSNGELAHRLTAGSVLEFRVPG
jgi:hypothetical protein